MELKRKKEQVINNPNDFFEMQMLMQQITQIEETRRNVTLALPTNPAPITQASASVLTRQA